MQMSWAHCSCSKIGEYFRFIHIFYCHIHMTPASLLDLVAACFFLDKPQVCLLEKQILTQAAHRTAQLNEKRTKPAGFSEIQQTDMSVWNYQLWLSSAYLCPRRCKTRKGLYLVCQCKKPGQVSICTQACKYALKYLLRAHGRGLWQNVIKQGVIFVVFIHIHTHTYIFCGNTRVINLFFIYSRIKYCSVTHACKFLLD